MYGKHREIFTAGLGYILCMYWKFSQLLILELLWRACVRRFRWPLERNSAIGFECLGFMPFTSALCGSNIPLCKVLERGCIMWGCVCHWLFWISLLFIPVTQPPAFYVGKGSRSAINHHTAGGDHSLWGCLFWVLGRPESFKRSVLRSARWEKGGYRRWQWVRVSAQVFFVSQMTSVCGGSKLSWWLAPLLAGRAPSCGCCSAFTSLSRATST